MEQTNEHSGRQEGLLSASLSAKRQEKCVLESSSNETDCNPNQEVEKVSNSSRNEERNM